MAGPHVKKFAMTIGRKPPIEAVILHEPEPETEGDSGFTILFSDAPAHASELLEDDPREGAACLGCLIDAFPEIGKGLDLAREHGIAERDPETREWVPGE